MKKIISLTILLTMLISLISACGNGNSVIQNTSLNSDETITELETTGVLTDGLPDVNMEGFALRILHANTESMYWLKLTLDPEKQTGELIDDEIYRRNSLIEERFNADIQVTELARADIESTLKNTVAAGDDAYDVIMMYNISILDHLQYIADWNDVDYLNLDAPWWNPNASGVFNIGGVQYAIAGNFSLNVHSTIYCFVYNKIMYENLQIQENLYQIANDGKWTVDVLYKTAKNAIRDLNGDGIFDENDSYGMHNAVKHVYNTLLLGSDVKYTSKDSDGFPIFSLPDDQNSINKMMHIIELAMSDYYFYVVVPNVNTDNIPENFFENGHSLYAPVSLNIITQLREMEDDIGILPAPKYDEKQEKYNAPAYGSELSLLPLSYSIDRIDNIGILLEALSFYSDQNILPIYKEVLIKTKSSRDSESESMVDIIFENVIFEFGINAWQNYLSTPLMTDLFLNINTNISSTLETIRPVLEGKANDLKNFIQSLS